KQHKRCIMVVDLYIEKEDKYVQTFMTDYAQIEIIPELKRIPGVGQAMAFGGSKDYSMRVWLDPNQMATYKLTPADVMAAIQHKNVEAAPGKLEENSQETFTSVIKYKGKLNHPTDY